MKNVLNAFVFCRVVIGLFFVLVAVEKLLSHYQNFLYVVHGYQVFPAFFEEIVARTLPWIELFLGLFLVLGLWLKPVLQGFCVLFAGFLIIVGQAMIRGLDLSKCGCFGEWISVPLPGVFVLDSTLLLFVILMLLRFEKTSQWSLDRFFVSDEEKGSPP
ncbi:MAG: hypothetical protein NUV91_00520 [Candidatus Omnitrophica bacterium]|nr:hypothetical protein [Candidatus Omnitrophota bacterium]